MTALSGCIRRYTKMILNVAVPPVPSCRRPFEETYPLRATRIYLIVNVRSNKTSLPMKDRNQGDGVVGWHSAIHKNDPRCRCPPVPSCRRPFEETSPLLATRIYLIVNVRSNKTFSPDEGSELRERPGWVRICVPTTNLALASFRRPLEEKSQGTSEKAFDSKRPLCRA